MKKILYIVIITFSIVLSGCKSDEEVKNELTSYYQDQINKINKNLTTVIINDIFSPPVASRIYAYPNITAYEILAINSEKYEPLKGKLNDFKGISKSKKEIHIPTASMVAFTEVASKLVNDPQQLYKFKDELIADVKNIGIDKTLLNNSIEYGHQVSKEVLEWIAKDNYLETRTMEQYSLSDVPSKWEPTPPDYMSGIEPNWMLIRPLLLEKPNMFKPATPTTFDSLRNSLFYQEAVDVYKTSASLDDEKIEIAKFWDCNPNISYTKGHVKMYYQKLSPGGHWMEIVSTASHMQSLSFEERSLSFTLTSIALFDAFISCWDEKYRSDLIRPETYINRYIDIEWKPLLQTPAFPEYTSGHSVVSSAASTILTELFGDNFAFNDSSEIAFDLPIRSFASFNAASKEAAISRLYGGIHYRPAIDNGLTQGKKVGELVAEKLSKLIENKSDLLSERKRLEK